MQSFQRCTFKNEGDEIVLLIVQQVGYMFAFRCGDGETVCDLFGYADDVVILTVQFHSHPRLQGLRT